MAGKKNLLDLSLRLTEELRKWADTSSSAPSGSSSSVSGFSDLALRSPPPSVSSLQQQQQEVFERAQRLSKALRKPPAGRSTARKGKGRASGDEGFLPFTVAAMKESAPGKYSRAGPPIELSVPKDMGYASLAEKARKATNLQLEDDPQKSLVLFKASGTIISDEEIAVGGIRRWTIGNYLTMIAKRSASQVTFGVGFVSSMAKGPKRVRENHREGPTSSKKARPATSPLKTTLGSSAGLVVKYRPTDLEGLIPGLEMDRVQVWVKESGSSAKDLDKVFIYHPEDDLYCISSISLDGRLLLGPVLVNDHWTPGVLSASGRTGHEIVFQSPRDTTLKSFSKPLPLCCISSHHSCATYQWCKLGEVETQYLSTAVIYVSEIGIYQCSVTSNSDHTTIQSAAMSVSVQPGTELPARLLCDEVMPEEPSSSSNHERAPDNSTILLSSSDEENVKELENPVPASGRGDMQTAMPEVGGNSDVPSTGSGGSQMKLAAPKGAGDGGSVPVHGDTIGCLLELPHDELAGATAEFTEGQIGAGAFGKVYKAIIRGRTYVAIKVLNENDTESQSGAFGMLQTEVTALCKFRHRNLVDLLGYCKDPPALIFEYMEQGSLFDHLHKKSSTELNWNQRARVLKGACRGLTWLHESVSPLIHQDMKSANILIDRQYNGKLGDFGFALQLPEVDKGRTYVTTATFARTEGYYAPELHHGQLSPKCDVYSYGVVMLEAYTRQRVYSDKREDRKLTDHLQEKLQRVADFVTTQDPTCGELAPYLQQIYFRIITACLQKLSKRPSSTEVMRIWDETNF